MAAQYKDRGVPFLRSQNIHALRLDLSDVKYIDEGFHRSLKKSALRPGDVVTVRTGKPGATAVVPPTLAVANCADLVITRPGKDLDSRWLSYYMNGAASGFVASRLVGAVQQHFNVSSVREVSLKLPPIEEQRGIAATLGALDDKIDSNRRIVNLLEQLIQCVFSQFSRTAVTTVPLRTFAVLTKGVSYRSADLAPSTTALVTLKSFDRRGGYKPEGLKAFRGLYRGSQRIQPGELAVAQTDLTQGGEVVGRVVRVPASPSASALVASLDVAIVRPLSGIPNEFLYGVLNTAAFRDFCRQRTSGTTVLHLAPDAIPSYPAPAVPPSQQVQYAASVQPLLLKIDALARESEAVGRLRDTLLPELLSGRIRVPEAQEAIADALD